jgi:hypothetical protein
MHSDGGKLNLIITGVDGVPGGLPEIVNDSGKLIQLEPPGRRELLDVSVEARLRPDALVGARQRRGAAGLELVRGHSPDVPDLAEEERPLRVDGVHDGLPGLDVLRRPDPRRVGVPLRRVGDARGLGDEQAAGGGALGVVERGVRLRDVAVGALPRERRQDDPVIIPMIGR